MLKITLYKNCILNNKYQEVFSLGKETGQENSVLERYLNSLESIDLPNILNTYYENTGELVFDNEIVNENIYLFNYMKIRSFDDETNKLLITRYCFINKIELKNEVCYISYSEDIWSSYGDKIAGILPSYFSSSRFLNYPNLEIPWKSLPVEYDGNKQLNITKLISSLNVYNLVVELQYYTLDVQGQPTERHNVLCYILNINGEDITRGLEVNDVYAHISKIITLVSSGKIDNIYNFEVGDFYLLPSDFALTTMVSQVDFSIYKNNVVEMSLMEIPKSPYYLTTIFSYDLSNNYKNKFIGNFTSQIELNNIGLKTNIKIKAYVNEYNLKLQLECNNQILDITDNYRIEVPFESLLSEEVSQKQVARELKNIKSIFGYVDSGLSIAKTLFGRMDSIKNSLSNVVLSLFSKNPGSGIKSSGSQTETTFDLIDSVKDIAETRIEQIYNNLPIFSTTNGKFTNTVNFVNSLYGLVVFSVDSVNDAFVKEIINNYGYNIYNIVKDYSKLEINNPNAFIANSCNYNSIKFETFNCYGSFTLEIAEILNSIFKKGIKIWYDYQMREDNYVV